MYSRIFEKLTVCGCGVKPQIAIERRAGQSRYGIVCEHCGFEVRAEAVENAAEWWNRCNAVPEVRGNPYHDPKTGRFTSGKGIDNKGESGIIDIEIDEFVPCLKDSKTGELLATEVKVLPKSAYGRYTSENGWNLNWNEIPEDEDVFGIYLKGDTEPQGLIALRKSNGGMFISHISTAPQNNKQLNNGDQKYHGVGGHLFAVAINESVNAGNQTGCVYGFAVNKKVLNHYVDKFGAVHFPVVHEFQFLIDGDAAQNVIDIYNFERG